MVFNLFIKNRIVLIVLFISICLISCESKKSKALELVQNGRNKLAFSDIKGAKADFDKAVKLCPELPEAWFYRGNVWFNMNILDSAMSNYNKALLLKDDFGEAYSNRAKIKFVLGDKDGACSDWLNAEKLGIKNLREQTKWCK